MRSPTFVLIHGANGNSFSWAPLQRELALLGHRSLAVDLPGHGFGAAWSAAYQSPQDPAGLASAPSASAGVTLGDAVAQVADTVRRAREHGPVIVVGHSRGGITLTALANAVPDLLARIVYISAWCCVDATPAEYMAGSEYAESALNKLPNILAADPAALGALRMNWRTAHPGTLDALKNSMLADCGDAEFLAYLNLLEPDESLDAGTPEDRADPETWGRVPHTYIRLTQDTSMPLALQDRFIREADARTPGNPFDVRTLESSHSGFLVRPGAAAAMLAELAAD